MAREFYGYFDSVAGDEREYDAAQFAHILRAALRNGVTSHENGGLGVAAQGGNMDTLISPGGCVINGYLYVLSDDGGDPKRFTHPASAANDRWDRIVARLETMTDVRKISLRLLTGTPGANPEPPTLTRTDSVYELALAKVKIRAAAESVEEADVVDERGEESVCGYAVPIWLDQATLDGRYIQPEMTAAQVEELLAAADAEEGGDGE